MSHLDPVLPEPRQVAYALIPGHEEIACIANDVEVLTRVVVLRLVATTRPDQYPLEKIAWIRQALRESDWEGAIAAWMEATGERVNIFPDEAVWTDALLDEERFGLELAAAPIFSESGAC